ncbi:MAG: peptidylprolyl isomerase [Gammaproteobacteria bacterium]
MQRLIITLISLFLLPVASLFAAPVKVQIDTNLGAFVLKLEAEKAPRTVENFLRYVDDGFYSDTLFHRVIDGFMVQGGGYTPDFAKKDTRAPVLNEADNGLKNLRGTIAMARTSEPHSATAQFFVNVVDNAFLDHTGKSPRGWGYCVFGKVVSGMEVIDKIRQLPTTGAGPFPKDVPQQRVVITSARRLDATTK